MFARCAAISIAGRALGRWVTLLLVFTFPASPGAGPAAWPPIPPEAWEQAARPDSGGADAIILLDDGEARDQEGEFRYTHFRRIRVFTEAGRNAGRVEFDYRKGDHEVTEIRARSVRRDGSVTEISPDQIFTTTILKSGGIEYLRTSFIVPGIEPGCIVEFDYALRGHYRGGWMWSWSFQNEMYTCTSRFRWVVSDWAKTQERDPRWHLKKILESQIEIACTPDCDHPADVTFAAHAMPGWRAEAWTPPIQDAGPQVTTFYLSAPFRDEINYWSFWKRRLDEIAQAFNKSLGPFDRVIQAARSRDPNPEEALAGVHRWLQHHVRSTAELNWQEIQSGKGLRSPWGRESSVKSLLARGEGSPYEINLAFAGAAAELGFEASVLLVRDRREGSFDRHLVGWFPTEAITAVRSAGGTRWRFYDPASRFAQFGSVPWSLRGGSGLVAGSGKDLILKVGADEGRPGHSRWTIDLSLEVDGSLAGTVRGELSGEQAREGRAWLWTENPDRWSDLMAKQLIGDEPLELELESVDVRGAPDSAFVLKGHLAIPHHGHTSGSIMTVPVGVLAPWRLHGVFEAKRRRQSIFFRYVRYEDLTVDLHLPPGLSLESLPAPGRFENGLGSWSSSWERLPDGVRWIRRIEIKYAELPPDDYSFVREFFRALADADREVLVLETP